MSGYIFEGSEKSISSPGCPWTHPGKVAFITSQREIQNKRKFSLPGHKTIRKVCIQIEKTGIYMTMIGWKAKKSTMKDPSWHKTCYHTRGFSVFAWTIRIQLVMPMKSQNARFSLSVPRETRRTSRVVRLENERSRTAGQPAPIPHLPAWWFNTLNPRLHYFKNKIKGKEMKRSRRVAGCWRDSLACLSSCFTFALSRVGPPFLFSPSYIESCFLLTHPPLSPLPRSAPPHTHHPSVPRKPAWWITDVLWHIVSFITQQPQSRYQGLPHMSLSALEQPQCIKKKWFNTMCCNSWVTAQWRALGCWGPFPF